MSGGEIEGLRGVLIATCILSALMLASPAAGVATQREGPTFVTAVQWDAGTLLTWTPADDASALYQIYRGTSVNDLKPIARTATPLYYDLHGDAGGVLLYAVTIIVGDSESRPTYLEVTTSAKCVSASMSGSFVVRPYNCVLYR